MRSLRASDTYNVNSFHFVKETQDNCFLTFLYHNPIGMVFQKFLISRPITSIIGKYYDSKFSRREITSFIEKNNIPMEEFKEKKYHSFNDFFTREKKIIHFSRNKDYLCSPCDGYLSAYKLTKDKTFMIKGISYTLEELLQNHSLVNKYQNGFIYIFRLTPKNYHRYHYFDDGVLLMKKKIPGVFHTVRPVALAKKRVFIENQREYALLSTKNFQDVIFMEVGALAVGKIKNHDKKKFKRGEEKGMFLFGGSTVIVLFEKDVLKENKELLKFSKLGYEALVKCGSIIGERI